MDCLLPELTTMLSAFTARPPDIRLRLPAIASRSSAIPMLGGYRVMPFWMAWIPACAAGAGVSKSGSPTPRSYTSSPAALRRLASLLMATVSEALRCCTFGDSGSGMRMSGCGGGRS